MNISPENEKWLIENVPDAKKLMNGDVGDLLSALGVVIEYNGFDDEGDYNAFGNKAQEVYDDIYEFA